MSGGGCGCAGSLANLAHALSDPVRLLILFTLCEAPGYMVDLAPAFSMSKQDLSDHLACLRRCGLVDAVVDGVDSWYRLADQQVASAIDQLRRVALWTFDDPDPESNGSQSVAPEH